MSVPPSLPIRVLIKGQSLVHDISERPQLREMFTFSRVLEEELLASGHNVDLWTAAVASEEARHAMLAWEQQVKAWSPDVVILSYGQYEPVHLLAPHWLERHANSLTSRPGLVRTRYRRRLLRPLWVALAKGQRLIDRRVGSRGYAWKVRRADQCLRRFIDATLEVGKPLIVLLEFIRPGARGRDWFPGMEARTEMMNAMLHQLIADYADPDIRLLPVPQIVEQRLAPGIEPNADGFHYNAEMHQYVGEGLAEEIRSWVKDYPRLAPRG